MKEVKSVTFSVNGEFITTLSREKCFYEGKFKYAVELLMSCMETDELSKREIYHKALDILNGEAELKGVYPNEDYGLEYLESKDDKWDLGNLFENLSKKIKTAETDYRDLLEKYLFIIDQMEDWEKKKLNREYKEEYGKVLFEGIYSEAPSLGNSLLDSFIKRQMSDSEDDYGWLEPNGTFHAVEWGEHQDWADKWMQENLTEEEYLNIDSMKRASKAGDYLIERGWVLLHNPAQGIATPTRNETRQYTKKQKDFLFDYFMKRDCASEANSIYQE
ncbi:MAG: hypothetical protein ACK5MV_12630 [Aminipila sp.]